MKNLIFFRACLVMTSFVISNSQTIAAEARVNQLYATNCNNCKLQQQSVTLGSPIPSNSNFRFISANPSDPSFTGNDLNGTLVYKDMNNVTITIYGTISRTVKQGNTQLGVYMAETNNTYATLTGKGYVLVIPGQESGLANGQSHNTASDPMDQVLNSPILPALGLNLKGQKSGKVALLTWSALSEKNTDKYIIERSVNGNAYQSVGKIASNNSAATSSNYSFSDKPEASQAVYYRIRLIDLDGREALSNIVSVNFVQHSGKHQLYPNPSGGQSFISLGYSGTFQIDLLSTNGQLIASQTVKASDSGTTSAISENNLQKGTYFIKITDRTSGAISTRKLIIQ
jgi:hypothetical protein